MIVIMKSDILDIFIEEISNSDENSAPRKILDNFFIITYTKNNQSKKFKYSNLIPSNDEDNDDEFAIVLNYHQEKHNIERIPEVLCFSLLSTH